MIRRGLIIVLCACLVSCSDRLEKDWQKGETGEVSRILDGDTLALNTGLVVRLASVESPRRANRSNEAEPFGEEAAEILKDLALGRRAEIYYPGMSEDRYERALGQVIVTSETGERIWLNEELVRQGAAWVRVYADTAKGSDPLWDAEAKARNGQTGLWEASAPILQPSDIGEIDGAFVITHGQMTEAQLNEDTCVSSLIGTRIEVRHDPVSGACHPTESEKVEIRGWARNGVVYVGSPRNFRPIPSAEP